MSGPTGSPDRTLNRLLVRADPVGRKKKQRLDAIKKKDWNALSSVMTEHFLEVGEWVLEGNRRRFRICRLI